MTGNKPWTLSLCHIKCPYAIEVVLSSARNRIQRIRIINTECLCGMVVAFYMAATHGSFGRDSRRYIYFGSTSHGVIPTLRHLITLQMIYHPLGRRPYPPEPSWLPSFGVNYPISHCSSPISRQQSPASHECVALPLS